MQKVISIIKSISEVLEEFEISRLLEYEIIREM